MAEFINTIDVLGDVAVLDSLIERTITEFKDDQLTKVGSSAFAYCTALTEVDLPNVTELRAMAFLNCKSLESVNLPELTTLGNTVESIASRLFENCTSLRSISLPKLTILTQAIFRGCTALENIYLPEADAKGIMGGVNFGTELFGNCKSLKTINLPKATGFSNAFDNCTALEMADFGAVKSFGNKFLKCTSLISLILRTPSVATLSGSHFSDTPIASGTGYIYVPRILVDSYKTATNWSTYADQFRALEDYTVDGTTTGELDETKI